MFLFGFSSPPPPPFEIELCCNVKLQASPHDPENFPFVVLGNKIDMDGGNSRVVSHVRLL